MKNKWITLIHTFMMRGWACYLLTAVLFAILVDPSKIVVHNLNTYQNGSVYLEQLAKDNGLVNPRRIQQAKKYYRNLLKVQQDSVGAKNALGFCYYHQGDYKKAAAYYRDAADRQQQDYGLHYNLGRMYMAMGKYEQALAQFEEEISMDHRKPIPKVTMIDPLNPENTLMNIDYLKGKYARSIENMVLIYKELQDYQKMFDLAIRSVSQIDGRKEIFLYHAAYAAVQLKRLDLASNLLEKSIAINPGIVETYNLLIRVTELQGLNKKAAIITRVTETLEQSGKLGNIEAYGYLKHLYFVPAVHYLKIDGKLQRIVI